MRHATYRDQFRPLIGRVLAACKPRTPLAVKRYLLRLHFDEVVGESIRRRGAYLYRLWCDEARIQLGLRPPRFGTIRTRPSLPGQLPLFPEVPYAPPAKKPKRKARVRSAS